MKNWAIFIISGQGLDPHELSSFLNLIPDKIKTNEYTNISYWQINSPLKGDCTIEEHLSFLLKKLYPVRKKIQGLSKKYDIKFVCNFSLNDTEKKIQVSSMYLSFMGYLGANLEIYLE